MSVTTEEPAVQPAQDAWVAYTQSVDALLVCDNSLWERLKAAYMAGWQDRTREERIAS